MLLLLLLVLPIAAVVPLAPALDIIIYGMSRTGLPAASWLWLCLWLWLWVWLARPPVWLQRETDSIMVMVMVIVSTCAAGVMPRIVCLVLSCLVLSCLAMQTHAPDGQQTNSCSTRLPPPGTHNVLCCVPLLFTWSSLAVGGQHKLEAGRGQLCPNAT
jgi:hypothetical protein